MSHIWYSRGSRFSAPPLEEVQLALVDSAAKTALVTNPTLYMEAGHTHSNQAAVWFILAVSGALRIAIAAWFLLPVPGQERA